MPEQLVKCTVEGGEGRNKLRRATVQLPNTGTFGELLELARKRRYGALEFEGPVYGCSGELETTLRDTWVRNGCKIDGTLHIGLAVVVSFPSGGQKTLSLIMGPGDTVNEVKQVSVVYWAPVLDLSCPNIYFIDHVRLRRLVLACSSNVAVCEAIPANVADVTPSTTHTSKYPHVVHFLCAASTEGLRCARLRSKSTKDDDMWRGTAT